MLAIYSEKKMTAIILLKTRTIFIYLNLMKNTNSFERGQDPIKSLGIGLVNILVEEIEKAPPLFAPNKIVKYFPKTQYVKVIFSSIAVSSLYHLYIQDLAKTPKYRDLIRYVRLNHDRDILIKLNIGCKILKDPKMF